MKKFFILICSNLILLSSFPIFAQQQSAALEKQPSQPTSPAEFSPLEIAKEYFKPTVKLAGRLQTDIAFYDSDRQRLGSGTIIRRLWLEMNGKLTPQIWRYRLQFGIERNELNVYDAYMRFQPSDNTYFDIGHFREPFFLNALISNNHLTFLERALPNMFEPNRRIGIGGVHYQQLNSHHSYHISGGIFGETQDADPESERDEGYGVSARAATAYNITPDTLFMIGVAGNYRRTNGEDTIRFRTRPETRVTNVRLIDTGDLAHTKGIALGDIQGAVVYHNYSLQGELVESYVQRERGLSNARFSGWYLFASWFLTGESRVYNPQTATFVGITPRNKKWGAWELAGRVSEVDLDDGNIEGGRELNTTLGLNWYVTRYIRFYANYIKVFSKRQGIEDDPQFLTLRAHFYFD